MTTNTQNNGYKVIEFDWTTNGIVEHGLFSDEDMALQKAQMIATKRGWTKVSDYHYIKYVSRGDAGRITVESGITDIQIVEDGQHDGESIVLTTVNNQILAEMAAEYCMPFPTNIVHMLQFVQKHANSERITVKYHFEAIYTIVTIDHDGANGKTSIFVERLDSVQEYRGDLVTASAIQNVLMQMLYGE